jgi:glycine oxidase
MTNSTQVAIIGGGAMGCAVAYYLAKAGIRSTIIESEGIATQASGYNAGGLNPLQGAGIPGTLSNIAAATFKMHSDLAQRLEDESSIEYHHKTIAFVTVAFDDSDIPEMQNTHDIFEAADGFNAHWLDAAELRQLEPRLNPEAQRGMYAYGNAILSGYEFTLALASAAERMGAEIRQGRAVGLQTKGDRVIKVTLEDGELACDAVVIASGPWSAQAGEWLGVNIPVEPYKGEILRLQLDGAMPPYDFSGGGANLHIRADGLLWAGATEERKGFDRQPSEYARRTLMKGATKLMPSLKNAKIAKHTACLRPLTPDWLPIVGATPGWDNAYLATGAGKKGILLAPAIGSAVADIITNGHTAAPIAEFDVRRFE